jgi:hypothetical protein
LRWRVRFQRWRAGVFRVEGAAKRAGPLPELPVSASLQWWYGRRLAFERQSRDDDGDLLFVPRNDKPVYCSDCFSKQRSYSGSYR